MEFQEKKDDSSSQKFLAFYLNEKNYAFPILKVNEVIVLPEITPMPKTPEYIKGIINLRGEIIPIIDLRLSLNIGEREYDKQTCVIIVKMQIKTTEKMVGFIVDCVSEVFEIQSSNIDPPPQYGEEVQNDFISGIGKVKDKIVILLDINKILVEESIENLADENLEKYITA